MRAFSALLPIVSLFSFTAIAQDIPALVDKQLGELVQTYKGIHAHPELSHHEEQTSALLAGELRNAGYTVTEHVGKYPDGSQAYGLVGILKNGTGPTLLVRADMDALPVVEETGVSYASHVKAKNPAGQEVGVMHACGHDVHVTTMVGVARTMAALKSQWHGTLMLVGQPSEETIDGAKAMMADHLYERFGKPDIAIALHDTSTLAAGQVGMTSGPALASSISYDVTMRGIGGHGSTPQAGKDPIVMAAEFIVELQTVVSRSEDPQDPAVITVGDIHGGTKRNIIPNEVKMELTTRAFSDKARQTIFDGITRTAKGVGVAAGVPENLMPVVKLLEDESTPVLYNDPALSLRVKAALVKALGAKNVSETPRIMGSEDFGVLGDDHKIPVTMFWLGAADPAKLAAAQAAGKELPGPHTSKFEPLPEPTLRTGVTAMSSVAIALLQ
ncbi:amidohydrolase [Granulicella arctica]|uniref:Hippurate hydrolase n=1 Tax=Granulicella arctica TaxID=940613 RepID=A0A7Y9PD34_9BACT|nr:amidohydrolase [Granulicella arctica]NYF77716.1 hippurate hydrolase [Granulicella arctica]